ncbi:hypothetical protein DFJ74DRAFT_603593 [Hyaloraphidium curvatum]|nr:hypothetical protein DFJ74DRAFT_603593 [Hyaloraphidium curvatum]
MPSAANCTAAGYPRRADLHSEIYRPFPTDGGAAPPSAEGAAAELASAALTRLADALANGSSDRLAECFLKEQCYWRDTLAFTYHFRTFADSSAPRNLAALARLRRPSGFSVMPNSARCMPSGPNLTVVDFSFAFATGEPAARCTGSAKLVSEKQPDGSSGWKIWTLTTWLDAVDSTPWVPSNLALPARNVSDETDISTDVLIVGGGNSGVILGARLKELGMDYLVVERNARPGDNWRLRYDPMRFHLPASSVQMPYVPYPKDLPRCLSRDNLADQVELLVKNLGINLLLSSHLLSTCRDAASGRWIAELSTPQGRKTVSAGQLVQATGLGSSAPYLPEIPGKNTYRGVSVHSVAYKNAKQLVERGCQSAVVVGSANTAFDVLEDCHSAGIRTTMIQRSPTYVIPVDYVEAAFGRYDGIPADLLDKATMGQPIAVRATVGGVGSVCFASRPSPSDRYKALAEAGFQVVTTEGDITQNVMEKAGRHYIDMGGTKLISERSVGIRSGVVPAAYTERGLLLSDGTEIDADAIVWCTGFMDISAAAVAERVFGEGGAEIGARMDATWGLDSEGELRGCFKRHLHLDDFYIFGGAATHQRYYSKFLALQIAGTVGGWLREAYRDTL